MPESTLEKYKSAIRIIEVDEATYKDTHKPFTPTFINYMFGNNGSGKSTLAKAIASGRGITFAPGTTAADYKLLVYNQDYINNSVRSYHNLPGVFTINSTNVEIQAQIDHKRAKLKEAEDSFSKLNEKKLEKEGKQKQLLKELQDKCWELTTDIRTNFDKTQIGKKQKKLLADELMRHARIEGNIAELKRMYDSSYSAEAKSYPLFNNIGDTSALDSLAGNDILSTAIVNAAETNLATFLKDIGATEWVRQGHEEFHKKANGACPYCSRPLDKDFELQLLSSFDDRYQQNLQKLNDFLESYKAAANTILIPLQNIPQDIYPEIDIRTYNDKLAALKGTIASNISKINSKIAEPNRIITLDSTSDLLSNLSEIINEFNALIQANNEIVATGPQKKTECTKAVFDHMAFMLKDVLDEYKNTNDQLLREIKELDENITAAKSAAENLTGDIRTLNSQTVETETAMQNINAMLKSSGFTGFELRPHSNSSYNRSYEIIRCDTGRVADNLSEGEKNFIAFLYFYHQVFGSDTEDNVNTNKIVVIDDPVSSMDSSSLFIVATLTRKMIEVCRNTVDNRDAVISGNFIKQIFILTHNTYFHREVTHAYANCWDFVSFYLIRKINNKSMVKLCDAVDPDRPTTSRINVNPVKNAYAALWEEFKEVQSTIPLMNVIRRILEHYYLQLCGFEGVTLRKVILEEHKEEFTHDEFGNEDYTKYDIASSMLSYISNNSFGINDGMNYVDEVIDPELCRIVFRMIFDCTHQEQHYKMMIR